MQHDHCWHDTGVMLLSHPPQLVERCCHCGETQNRSQSLFMDGKVHGPHMRGWQSIDEGVTIPVVSQPETQ
jgi:hypothetical protein